MQGLQRGRESLVERLAGRSCSYCEDGQLESGTYKGSDAVLCSDCDVPQVRFF